MTDKELLDAAWRHNGGYLTREVFIEALKSGGEEAFELYMKSSDRKLPDKVHSHWERLLGIAQKEMTLAA